MYFVKKVHISYSKNSSKNSEKNNMSFKLRKEKERAAPKKQAASILKDGHLRLQKRLNRIFIMVIQIFLN